MKARYPQLNCRWQNKVVATDTVFSSVKALGKETCWQIYYATISHFLEVYTMVTESEGSKSLLKYIKERGAPVSIHSDNSKMQTGKAWNDICNMYNISQSTTEPHHPQQNPSERMTQTVKVMIRAIMEACGCPLILWCYCLYYVIDLLNVTAHPDLNWRTPTEKAYGYTPDISPFLHFRFWDAVYYLDHDSFPSSNEKLGYWLGVTRNCDDAFTYYVYVPETHQVIARSVLRAVRDSPNHPNLQVARDPNIFEVVNNDTVMDSSDDEADLFHSKNNNLFVDEYDMFIPKNNSLKVFPNFICPSSFYKSNDNSLSSNSYCGSHLSVGNFTEEEIIKEINMQDASENQKDDTFM